MHQGADHADTLTQASLDMGSATSDGSLKEIPYGFYLRAMFYNKDLLEEAGVDGPPETMQEFRDAAAAVSESAAAVSGNTTIRPPPRSRSRGRLWKAMQPYISKA